MKSLHRNLTALVLFLSAWPLFHSHIFTHAASASPPVTHEWFVLGTDETDPSFGPATVKTTLLKNEPPRPCNYDPCSENQEPCTTLSAKTGCLCPGVSGADEPPHSPRISAMKSVRTGNDKGKVEIRWCAPSSLVSLYRVVIEGSEERMEFQAVERRGVIRSLEAGTKVCVEAVNKAGSSSPSNYSCLRYDPSESSDHTLLTVIIGGGIALLLLITVTAVIIWQCKKCQKANRNSADGLGNPSYSTEATL